MSQHDPMRQALEEALFENPDDVASHMAYADYLREQGDPRGEFIQVQLALEDPNRSPNERKRLKRREEELLDVHEREWLGELAPLLLCTEEEEWQLAKAESHWDWIGAPYIRYSWARGWLDQIECRYLTVEMTRKLGRAPIARLLHSLVWRHTEWASRFTYADGPDLPNAEGNFVPFEVLAHYPPVANLRVFQVGEAVDPEEQHYRSRNRFAHLSTIVERMPRLEELNVYAYLSTDTIHGPTDDAEREEMRRLFSLPTLSNLRVLTHYNGFCYPLEMLAENAALGKLTHLMCYPNSRARLEGRDHGWATAISRAGVRAVCWSPHLKSLTHLQMRSCDGGDDMVEDIVNSGILRRLKLLDLRHGRVGDAGAKELARCPEVKGMQIDLVNNRLTDRGVSALLLAGAKLRSEDQQKQPYKTASMFRGELDIE
jgi:uncharacterized protein (TIGR02996 family)